MKLVKLKIKNYRCYNRETKIIIDDLTAIIGKNDIGKSAILEAIDAFFNDTVDRGDLSVNCDEPKISITCIFDNLPEEIVLDSSESSKPEDEGILNTEKQLEVLKTYTFSNTGRMTKAIYLKGEQPSDQRISDLLSKKNSALKDLARELDVNFEGVDRRSNVSLRRAIRDHIGSELSTQNIKVDGSLTADDNLKKIWKPLSKMLPVFSLFKSDKTFDDKDSDIKNPLKSAIKEALAIQEIQVLLEQVEERVRRISTDVADMTLEKLKNFDENLSERMRSEFSKEPNYNSVFDLTLLNDQDIPLNKRGSGIRRLVVLSFFQAQAERRKTEESAPSIIYAIEEPETSQHPNHQQMIINALSELSEQDDVQVVFTTHSANLVREIPVTSLRYISQTEEIGVAVQSAYNAQDGSTDETVISQIISTLGILPNPADRVKVLLFVEGNHDVNALKRYSEIIHQYDNSYINLMKSEVVGYVITGGSALKHYIEQKHLDGLGKPELHIYDRDVADYITAVDEINNLQDNAKTAFNTSKSELENFLHPDAISEAYADNGNEGVLIESIEDDDDVPIEVTKKINQLNANNWEDLTPEKRKRLASNKKYLLNTLAVEKMSVDRLRERNAYEEICTWFRELERLSNL